jgi:hypothetical protein
MLRGYLVVIGDVEVDGDHALLKVGSDRRLFGRLFGARS